MSATHRRHPPRCIVRAPRASAKSIRRRVSGKGGMDKERGEAQRARLARASDIAASTSLRARFSALVGRGANSSKIPVKTCVSKRNARDLMSCSCERPMAPRRATRRNVCGLLRKSQESQGARAERCEKFC